MVRKEKSETLLRNSSTLVVVTAVVTRVIVTLVVVYSVEPSKPEMQLTSLPFTEQLSAAAVVVSNVIGVASSSADKPMSSGVMLMPHRLPAAIHAFKHTQTHTYTYTPLSVWYIYRYKCK